VGPLYLLIGSGFIASIASIKKGRSLRAETPLLRLLATIGLIAIIPITWESLLRNRPRPDALTIFLYFLKLGSVLYGRGYVLLAFLQRDLVTKWQWLTKAQLFDAIAVGQFTPGPVFTTATFIGYVLAGPVGAVVATVGIFIPAFLFVAVSGRV